MSFDLSPVRVAQLLQPHAEKVLDHLLADDAPDEIVKSAQAIRDMNHMISTLDDAEVVLKLRGETGPRGIQGVMGATGPVADLTRLVPPEAELERMLHNLSRESGNPILHGYILHELVTCLHDYQQRMQPRRLNPSLKAPARIQP